MLRYLKRLVTVSISIFSCCIALAEVRLPAIIPDNMVLQQKSAVALWGWAAPGEKVNVQAGWNKISFTDIADGRKLNVTHSEGMKLEDN